MLDQEFFERSFEWEFFPNNLNVNDFTNWFIANAEEYQITSCILPTLFLKVERSSASLCFKNSQLMTLNNNSLIYCEGILLGQEKNRKYHHAFNLKNEKVIDVTYLKNKAEYVAEIDCRTLRYFGVEIPLELLNEVQIRSQGQYEHKPLIYEYFRSLE